MCDISTYACRLCHIVEGILFPLLAMRLESEEVAGRSRISRHLYEHLCFPVVEEVGSNNHSAPPATLFAIAMIASLKASGRFPNSALFALN